MSLKFWLLAACHAAYMYRVQALGIQMLEGVPQFGHRVMVPRPTKHVEDFEPKLRRHHPRTGLKGRITWQQPRQNETAAFEERTLPGESGCLVKRLSLIHISEPTRLDVI
eukprot:6526119-Prorocentrum_lima.AAC.1